MDDQDKLTELERARLNKDDRAVVSDPEAVIKLALEHVRELKDRDALVKVYVVISSNEDPDNSDSMNNVDEYRAGLGRHEEIALMSVQLLRRVMDLGNMLD